MPQSSYTQIKPHPPIKNPTDFYQIWLLDPTCKEIIQNSWVHTAQDNPNSFLENLNRTTKALQHWNHHHFGHVNSEIQKTRKLLQKARNKNPQDQAEIKSLEDSLKQWYQKPSQMIYQQSRDKILKFEDNNTKYFHQRADYRKRINNIDSLQDKQGNWLHSREDLQDLLNDHFSSITSSTNPFMDEDLLNIINTEVTEEDNLMLTAEPTDEEIRSIVFLIKPWAAPGPDGYQAGFYQHTWDIVGKEVINLVKQFFLTLALTLLLV